MSTLNWGDPQLHFWLRHARKAPGSALLVGRDAPALAALLREQEVNASAQEADDDAEGAGRQVGMVGLTDRECLTRAEVDPVTLLRGWQSALTVGGKLVIVLAVPDIRLIGRALESGGWSAPPERLETGLYRWRTTRCDPVAQILTHHDVYEEADAQGVTTRRWHQESRERYCFPRELRLLLESAGYWVEGGYSGWNDEPLDADATLQVWVARKSV